MLAHFSSYFEKALTGGFKEAKTQEVDLPDTEPGTFDAVQHWFYSQRLGNAFQKEAKDIQTSVLAKLWVFGDAHDIPALQNAVIDLLHQNIHDNWLVPTGDIVFVYSNTVSSALIRSYLITAIATTAEADKILADKHREKWCKDALWDLSKALWKGEQNFSKDSFKEWDLCKFHVHAEGVKCAKRAV